MNRLVTIEDRSKDFPLTSFGNEWSRKYYDGPFHVFPPPPDLPATSLVFVQTRNGNTGASNPGDLGGGPTDKYLLYEGLTRVGADAVLAGAASAGRTVFFSITHPEAAVLRRDLGLPQHPVQMVISRDGNVDLSSRTLSTPDARAFLLAGAECVRKLSNEISRRPWITMIPIDNDLAETFRRLRRDFGIGRISAIGGRATATSLVDAGLVQDIYLTTSTIDGGERDTPWYTGERPPRLETIVRKREVAVESPILFEHLAIGRT
ncbi:MAG: dihydrofolate reductase family protein [Acidobacteriota bacterium]